MKDPLLPTGWNRRQQEDIRQLDTIRHKNRSGEKTFFRAGRQEIFCICRKAQTGSLTVDSPLPALSSTPRNRRRIKSHYLTPLMSETGVDEQGVDIDSKMVRHGSVNQLMMKTTRRSRMMRPEGRCWKLPTRASSSTQRYGPATAEPPKRQVLFQLAEKYGEQGRFKRTVIAW